MIIYDFYCYLISLGAAGENAEKELMETKEKILSVKIQTENFINNQAGVDLTI